MTEEQVAPEADSGSHNTTKNAVRLSLDPLHFGFGIFLASLASWIGIVILGISALSIWIGSLF